MHEGFERVGVIGEGVVVAGDALNPDGGHEAQPFSGGWNGGWRKGGSGAHQINHNQNQNTINVFEYSEIEKNGRRLWYIYSSVPHSGDVFSVLHLNVEDECNLCSGNWTGTVEDF